MKADWPKYNKTKYKHQGAANKTRVIQEQKN